MGRASSEDGTAGDMSDTGGGGRPAGGGDCPEGSGDGADDGRPVPAGSHADDLFPSGMSESKSFGL